MYANYNGVTNEAICILSKFDRTKICAILGYFKKLNPV